MKKQLGEKELELLEILEQYRIKNNISTQSEVEKAIQNGTRTVEEQIMLWNLGEEIKYLRLEFEHINAKGKIKIGISQRELSKKMDNTCTATNLRRIEKGERSVSFITIHRILKALNINLPLHFQHDTYSEPTYWKMNLKHFYTPTQKDIDIHEENYRILEIKREEKRIQAKLKRNEENKLRRQRENEIKLKKTIS